MAKMICLTQENAHLYFGKKLYGKFGNFPYIVKQLKDGRYATVDKAGTMQIVPEKETNNDLNNFWFERAEEVNTPNETK